jgi:hypothetical protein
MRIKKLSLAVIFCLGFYTIGFSQNYGAFSKKSYPVHKIPEIIIEKRGLEEKIKMLASCDWPRRKGQYIDSFLLQTENGYLFGEVYEYFMDCDNLRLIYWFNNPSGRGEIVDFMIENLEDESLFVVAKRKHLKNKKKYKNLLKKELK